jgi:hypothetical protein
MDFYVLTENLADVSPSIISCLACTIVPPNVYYAETEFGDQHLRAKYAVLPLPLFAKWMARKTSNPYFWARFSQPSALVYVRNDEVRRQVIAAISDALRTSFANAKALTNETDAAAIWTAGFNATYQSELRSEQTSRAAQIVAASPDYYRSCKAWLKIRFTPIRPRRIAGSLVSPALIKAAFLQ